MGKNIMGLVLVWGAMSMQPLSLMEFALSAAEIFPADPWTDR